MTTTISAEHRQAGAWAGGGLVCGVECACGLVFDGFDTLGEARDLLTQHIDDEAQVTPERRLANALQAVDEYWAPELVKARQRAGLVERRLKMSWRKAGRATVHAINLTGELTTARRERDELAAFVHAVRDVLGLTELHSMTGRALMSDTLNGARNIMAALTNAQSTAEPAAPKQAYATGGLVGADRPTPAGGLPAYVDRVRASHHRLATGRCSCDNPVCTARFLLDHIDNVTRGQVALDV
jgi:hypothetical protein